jgi:tRNA 2-thiouridine synthesizing protein A
MQFDLEVDTSGLLCPLPLLRLKRALVELAEGQIVKLITTDPAAHLDIGVFSEQSGNMIIELIRQTDMQIFYVKKCN